MSNAAQAEEKIALPCGCKFEKDADAVRIWCQKDLGLSIVQCANCKLIVGIELERPLVTVAGRRFTGH